MIRVLKVFELTCSDCHVQAIIPAYFESDALKFVGWTMHHESHEGMHSYFTRTEKHYCPKCQEKKAKKK